MSLNLDFLQSLFGIRESLTDLIIQVAPANDDEQAHLRQLVQARDQVNGSINRLIALNVSDSLAGLESALGQIQSADKRIAVLNRDITGAKAAVAIVAQVVSIAATVIAAAVAL